MRTLLVRDNLADQMFRALSTIQHLPWVVGLYEKLPITPGAGVTKFREFARKCVTDRRARGAVSKDVFHYIVSDDLCLI